MGKALSLDLRERVVGAVAGGLSRHKAAERFGVSAASAIRWCALREATGRSAAKPPGGDRRSRRIEAQAEVILGMVAETPDITLEELRAKLAERGISAQCQYAVALLRTSADHVKKKTAHAAEQERPDILKRREDWLGGQLGLDPGRLVFIDETWASTNMARRYGRAPRGERLRAAVPQVTGRRPPSSPASGSPASSRRWSLMVQSTPPPSSLMSSSSSCRNSRPATLS